MWSSPSQTLNLLYSVLHVRLHNKSDEILFVHVVHDWCHIAEGSDLGSRMNIGHASTYHMHLTINLHNT